MWWKNRPLIGIPLQRRQEHRQKGFWPTPCTSISIFFAPLSKSFRVGFSPHRGVNHNRSNIWWQLPPGFGGRMQHGRVPISRSLSDPLNKPCRMCLTSISFFHIKHVVISACLQSLCRLLSPTNFGCILLRMKTSTTDGAMKVSLGSILTRQFSVHLDFRLGLFYDNPRHIAKPVQ